MFERLRTLVIALAVLVAVTAGITPFFLDVDATSPDPVAFDDTVSVGLTLEAQYGLDDEVFLPQVQVFYSQYEYVVGYYGYETFAEYRGQEGHDRQFGYPLAVYVTDFGATDGELTDEGYPIADQSFQAFPAWTEATDAWYVVDSEARTPAGETVVTFADRADAEAFVDDYGGTIRSWEGILSESFDRDDATVVRDRVAEHHAEADATVEAAAAHDDRPVSIVVGEDVATVQEGIDEAPADTTVLVPGGTYDETLEIDRPITLAGEGPSTIRGDDNGSVVTITAADVGIRDLEVTGVGPMTSGAEEVPGERTDGWDDEFQTHYTGADAAISAHVAPGLSVEGVEIETPSNGIILRESPDTVIRDVTIHGNEVAQEGFAGVMAFRSPSVVEETTFVDGRDSIYLYRSEGLVARNNSIDGGILGMHLMHNDGALLADNEIHNTATAGVYVMTGPERNAIVGNEITGSSFGLSVGGSDNYVADNVVAENDVGMKMDATASIYEGNLFAGNDVGANERAMLPTNRIVGNDFVGNDEHAIAGSGPLRIWTHDGAGNYWQGATGPYDGYPPDRPYTPTDPVDSRLHKTDGTPTLARAPAVDALAGFEESVSGMQTGSIVDLAPDCEPNDPERLAGTDWADQAPTCYGTTAGLYATDP